MSETRETNRERNGKKTSRGSSPSNTIMSKSKPTIIPPAEPQTPDTSDDDNRKINLRITN